MGNSLSANGDEDSGWLFNVLDFCDESTRIKCLLVSKRYCNILSSDASFRWRLDRLHIEKGVYFTNELPSDHTSWKSLYLELIKRSDTYGKWTKHGT